MRVYLIASICVLADRVEIEPSGDLPPLEGANVGSLEEVAHKVYGELVSSLRRGDDDDDAGTDASPTDAATKRAARKAKNEARKAEDIAKSQGRKLATKEKAKEQANEKAALAKSDAKREAQAVKDAAADDAAATQADTEAINDGVQKQANEANDSDNKADQAQREADAAAEEERKKAEDARAAFIQLSHDGDDEGARDAKIDKVQKQNKKSNDSDNEGDQAQREADAAAEDKRAKGEDARTAFIQLSHDGDDEGARDAKIDKAMVGIKDRLSKHKDDAESEFLHTLEHMNAQRHLIDTHVEKQAKEARALRKVGQEDQEMVDNIKSREGWTQEQIAKSHREHQLVDENIHRPHSNDVDDDDN